MSAGLDRYVVFGNPIAHSKSPDIHMRFAVQTGQHMVYERRLAPLDGFAQAVRDFIDEGGKGANVTVPFKLDAHALATTLTPRAEVAGAVNTLMFRDKAILGDNTDGAGMVADIVRNAGIPMAGKKVLLLGAGGAARGVILPVLGERPDELIIANRTVEKAEDLASRFAKDGCISASTFEALQSRFDIVINATSASLDGALPPLSPAVFDSATFAYDMMYGKEPTVFMRFASAHGATVRDGLGMLVEQAAESFFLWRGVRPDTATVYTELRARL